MGSDALVYKEKLRKNLSESFTHLKRVNDAFSMLSKSYKLPILPNNFSNLLNNLQDLAFADQVIYRFSKLQDSMGAKLFKSFLLYQGENIDRPFLDILHSLEKLNILSVEGWFELREIRNEIAHDYEENSELSRNALNTIFEYKNEMAIVLEKIQKFFEAGELK